jgi:hypothetical protein
MRFISCIVPQGVLGTGRRVSGRSTFGRTLPFALDFQVTGLKRSQALSTGNCRPEALA